jgi:threonine synthase
MKYVSTGGKTPPTSFRSAVFAGLAPDGGLYVPESVPVFPPGFVGNLSGSNLRTIGEEVMSAYIDDIPNDDLATVLTRAWTFPIPLIHLKDNLFLLELYHGPTLAFKDIGVRFLARILSYYLQLSQQEITIAVATSGDTGSAVAQGFFNVPHISVYVLYPSGKISTLQEQQMATLGGNIHALEVDGTFDDCQRLVKDALADEAIVGARHLTTANSINLGRLLPQVAYYVWGVAQWEAAYRSGNMEETPVFVIPSGNFGNLTAAVYAKAMGTPFRSLLAATNVNDAGAQFLRTGTFVPRRSVQTHSNAMDVGNPSNLARLRSHFRGDVGAMRGRIEAVSISDEETLHEIRVTYEKCGLIVDPHTAVGVAAARKRAGSGPTIVTATAHPGKFPDVLERALGVRIPLPEELLEASKRSKQSEPVPATYEAFREVLLRRWSVT